MPSGYDNEARCAKQHRAWQVCAKSRETKAVLELAHVPARLNRFSSPLIPAKAGIQGRERRRLLPWIPACAGMSGTCCSGFLDDAEMHAKSRVQTEKKGLDGLAAGPAVSTTRGA